MLVNSGDCDVLARLAGKCNIFNLKFKTTNQTTKQNHQNPQTTTTKNIKKSQKTKKKGKILFSLQPLSLPCKLQGCSHAKHTGRVCPWDFCDVLCTTRVPFAQKGQLRRSGSCSSLCSCLFIPLKGTEWKFSGAALSARAHSEGTAGWAQTESRLKLDFGKSFLRRGVGTGKLWMIPGGVGG